MGSKWAQSTNIRIWQLQCTYGILYSNMPTWDVKIFHLEMVLNLVYSFIWYFRIQNCRFTSALTSLKSPTLGIWFFLLFPITAPVFDITTGKISQPIIEPQVAQRNMGSRGWKCELHRKCVDICRISYLCADNCLVLVRIMLVSQQSFAKYI
jgi:hypothetical protein